MLAVSGRHPAYSDEGMPLAGDKPARSVVEVHQSHDSHSRTTMLSQGSGACGGTSTERLRR